MNKSIFQRIIQIIYYSSLYCSFGKIGEQISLKFFYFIGELIYLFKSYREFICCIMFFAYLNFPLYFILTYRFNNQFLLQLKTSFLISLSFNIFQLLLVKRKLYISLLNRNRQIISNSSFLQNKNYTRK